MRTMGPVLVSANVYPWALRWQRYHIACAEYRSGEQNALLILSHTTFHTVFRT